MEPFIIELTMESTVELMIDFVVALMGFLGVMTFDLMGVNP